MLTLIDRMTEFKTLVSTAFPYKVILNSMDTLAKDTVPQLHVKNSFISLSCRDGCARLSEGRVDGRLSPPTASEKHCLQIVLLKLRSTKWTQAESAAFCNFFPLFVVLLFVCRLFLIPKTATFCPIQEYHVQFAQTYCIHTVKINWGKLENCKCKHYFTIYLSNDCIND